MKAFRQTSHNRTDRRLAQRERKQEFARVPSGTGNETVIAPEYRIVSRPNGLWCAQVRITEKGKNADKFLKRVHNDGWQDIGRNTDKEAAMSLATTWAIMKRKPFNGLQDKLRREAESD